MNPREVNSPDESSGTENNKVNPQDKGIIVSRKKRTRRRRRRRRRQNDPLQAYQNELSAVDIGESNESSADGNCNRANSNNNNDNNNNNNTNNSALYDNVQLIISERDLSVFLRHYILSPDLLLGLGYPVESPVHPGCAVIYNERSAFIHFQKRHAYYVLNPNAEEFQPKSVFEHFQKYNRLSLLDPNAKEFVPKSINQLTGTHIFFSDGSLKNDSQGLNSVTDEKTCARCGSHFFMTMDGEYLTQEQCIYHWGKIRKAVTPEPSNKSTMNAAREYTCCRRKSNASGCTTGKLHVWDGLDLGINGPLDGYVRTPFPSTPAPFRIYALDCEMCYTTHGLEVIRVTLVAADGRPVYDSLVRPENCIIDYNTRFSGINESDLSKHETKSLQEVQSDLTNLINADTILVGHGLENDLRALRIIHGTVVDTSVIFPHEQRLPYRRSLKSLVSSLLNKEIQQGSSGHCSFEDASACIELMLWKIRKDFFTIIQPQAPYYLLI
jgi:RNA exonuclease 1